MPKKPKKPNKRESAFIESYIRCWKAAPSAREAGYSEKTARQIGYELLTKPYIQAAIETRLAEIRMGTNEIFARLSAQARADISEMVEFYDVPVLDSKGRYVGDRQSVRVKPDIFEKHGSLIKSITPTSNGDFKIEMYSAQTALELSGKTYSLFADRDDKGKIVTPVVSVIEIVKESKKE